MSDPDDHFCPGCGIRLPYVGRYPWYFCGDCLATAEDKGGRKLSFANASFGGGLSWRYADSDETHPDEQTSLVCLIRGRPVIVTEARFGGVVAQPVHEKFMYEAKDSEVDLTEMKDTVRPKARLGTNSALPKDWYEYNVSEGVNLNHPGIYEWRIESADADGTADVYIGKYASISRPTREYEKNIENLLSGRPYRLSNPNGFRQIHRELAKAVTVKRKITLTILENVDIAELNRRERELIAERGTLNGPASARLTQNAGTLKE